MMNAMLALARQFVATRPAADTRLPEFDYFPPDNLVAGSQMLQVRDAFGFDQFKNVFTAKYQTGEAEVLAFVTRAASVEAAGALRAAYLDFLAANGGKTLAAGANPPEATAVELMGNTEVVFSRGKVVGGVHGAPNLRIAQAVAAALQRKIAEVEP